MITQGAIKKTWIKTSMVVTAMMILMKSIVILKWSSESSKCWGKKLQGRVTRLLEK